MLRRATALFMILFFVSASINTITPGTLLRACSWMLRRLQNIVYFSCQTPVISFSRLETQSRLCMSCFSSISKLLSAINADIKYIRYFHTEKKKWKMDLYLVSKFTPAYILVKHETSCMHRCHLATNPEKEISWCGSVICIVRWRERKRAHWLSGTMNVSIMLLCD